MNKSAKSVDVMTAWQHKATTLPKADLGDNIPLTVGKVMD